MSLAQRIAIGLKKIVPGTKINYTAPKAGKIPGPLPLPKLRKSEPKFKQYGDPGYKPSNGKGVGH